MLVYLLNLLTYLLIVSSCQYYMMENGGFAGNLFKLNEFRVTVIVEILVKVSCQFTAELHFRWQ